jgi:hypothetical protein
MLLKFYHHLHPLFEVESSFVEKNYEDTSLDIFEMVVSTNEPTRELVIQEFLIFEIERIFFLANILTNLKRYHLQSNNLEKLFFVNKNQLNGANLDCNFPFNLVELIDSK